MVPLLIPLAPLAAAAVAGVRPGRWTAPLVTCAGAVAALAGALRTVLQVATTGNPLVPLRDVVGVDGLGGLVVGLVALVGTAAAFFSWGDLDVPDGEDGRRRLRRYYVHFNLFLFSLLAVPLVLDAALVWIAVELTTLLSVFLVGFDGTRESLEAAWKYVVLTLMGAAIALLGILLFYWALREAGGYAFTWDGLRRAAPRMPPSVLVTAFLLVLVGFGAKAGLVPLHTWLPDAHSQAPSPVCALLSGVETTAVLYVLLRLLPVVGASSGARADVWVLGFGLVSAGTAAFLMIQTTDYKRLFAFSTVEHMGIIMAAAGIGGPVVWYGAVYQIASHALTKALCFFAAGAAHHCTRTREMARVRGLLHLSPVAGLALLGGSLAIAGSPPFAVFVSEFAILRGAVAEGRLVPAGLLALFIVVAFCALMAHVTPMVFGRPPSSGTPRIPALCTLALVLVALPVVALGLFTPGVVHGIFRLAASSLGR